MTGTNSPNASERIPLGKTGLEVSPVCHGTWQAGPLWGRVPDDDLIAGMRGAFDAGINFFDTAPTYGEGRAETLLATALADLPRSEVVICNKCFCVLRPDGKRVFDLTGDSILRQCEASLERLKTDYIDLYLLHAFDPKADPADATAALEKLKADGKIRAYGVSNYTVEQLRMALTYGDYSALQPKYSLIDTEAEADLLPLAMSCGLGVLVYSPLAKGLLAGKYRGDETFDDSRKNSDRFQGDTFRSMCEKVRSLEPLAKKYGLTIPQLVLAATLMHPGIHCVITGVKRPEQIAETAAAIGHRIGWEDYEDIREALA